MRTIVLVLCLAGSVLQGCAESVMIVTDPPGANVFVNDKLVGLSPTEYSVEKDQLAREYSLRLEKPGFAPVADTLRTRRMPGRTTGAVFTLGILYLFRSPLSFEEREPYVLTQTLASDPQAERDRAVGQRLRQLQDSDPNSVIVLPPPRSGTPGSIK